MLVLGAWLPCGAVPARAADEPVATAPIPPLPRDQPAIVPLHSARPVAAPAKPAPRTAAKPERAAASRQHQRTETNRKKVAADTAAPGKRTKQRPAETGRRAERRKSHTESTEARAARIDQLRPPPDYYRPRRYHYREEIVGPPFPPPWYDRGPPFGGMPYPRRPMPPW